jgi:hypothetical protein
MINKIKASMYKHLNECKGHTNKQMNEIRKTMQVMKWDFNKDIEILKKFKNLKIKTSITQLKNSVDNLTVRLDQIKDIISGLEDGVAQLEH